MHYKNSVIICALYFVTATQSIGLNRDQFSQLRSVIQTHENDIDNITVDEFVNMAKSIGVDNISDFINKEDVSNARKLEGLLVFLADNEKPGDELKKLSLLPYEVRLYVDLFSDYVQRGNHNGLIDKNDLLNAMDALDLKNCINSCGHSPKKCLAELYEKCIYTRKEKMNVLEFLYRLWFAKPIGKGLDKRQVEDLIELRGYDHLENGNPIDAEKVTRFFKDLSIIKENCTVPLHSTRMTPLALQELLVITAEYSTKPKTGIVYTTSSVKHVLSDFSTCDADKDGLLKKEEFSKIAYLYMLEMEGIVVGSFVEKHDTNGDDQLDIAEFFLALFKENLKI